MSAILMAFEGIDGSGKGTQSALLCQNLQILGKRAAVFSFPQYQQTFFGRRIGEMLDGRFGSLTEIAPWAAALLFAGDRWESLPRLNALRDEVEVVILDRYVPSNIAHQAGRYQGEERARLRRLIEELEYDIYRVPRPDHVFLLDIPVAVAQQLVLAKKPRDYTDKASDLLEADAQYLEQTRQAYLELAASEPHWHQIAVTHAGQLRSTADIAAEILRKAT